MKTAKKQLKKSEKAKSFYYMDWFNDKLNGLTHLNLTAKERTMIRKKQKEAGKIKTTAQAKHFINTIMEMKAGRIKTIMMITVVRTKLIKAKLAMPEAELAYLRKSQDMYTAIHGNASGFFTTAFDMAATWDTQNGALDAAITDVGNGIPGAEGDWQTAMNDIKITLILALAYVNKLMLLNQRQAVAIATACFMEIVGRGTHDAQDIEVKIGKAAGQIIVKCKVPKDGTKKLMVTYFVEVSMDGGVSYLPLDPSHPSTIIVNDLASNKSVILRSRTWTKNGWSVWAVSNPIMPK